MPGPLRQRPAEQGCPAAARRGGRLPAVAAGHSAGRGIDPKTGETVDAARRSEGSRSRRSPSRSSPIRSSASSPTSGSTPVSSRAAPTSTTRSRTSASGSARLYRMHADHREEVVEHLGGRYRRDGRPQERPSPATRCATRTSRSSWKRSISRSRSSTWRSSRRRRLTRTRWASRLSRLSEEDPTFRVRTDQETGQTHHLGHGRAALEVIVDRMLREFRVDANVGRPQVAYRETISRPARAEGRFVRQRAAAVMYGHVWLEVEPLEPGLGRRLREQDRRRHGSAGVRPGRSKRGARGARGRRPGNLPGGRLGDAGRRLLPRGRLE